MYGEPPTIDLLKAVARFLESEAGPKLSGREAFLARVATNAIGIAVRELEHGAQAARIERDALSAILGRDDDLPALRAELCAALRSGRMDAQTPGLLEQLERAAVARVQIEQPGYASLSRVGPVAP